jgi:hypothetical protein
MGVGLVRVENQGAAMSPAELLAREYATGSEELLRGRSSGHGQDDVVKELHGPPASLAPIGRACMSFGGLEVPVGNERVLDSIAFEP